MSTKKTTTKKKEVIDLPVENVVKQNTNYEMLFTNLQETYKMRTQELQELAAAYQKLLIKYNTAAEVTMKLLEGFNISLNLLFPKTPKGGN